MIRSFVRSVCSKGGGSGRAPFDLLAASSVRLKDGGSRLDPCFVRRWLALLPGMAESRYWIKVVEIRCV